MKFIFDMSAAESLAHTLEKVLAARMITLGHDQALDVLAELQGASNWSTLASTLSPTAIRDQLAPHERRHLRLNHDCTYGPEEQLRAQNGFGLCYGPTEGGCDYVRVIDPLGREIDYYSAEEWQEDPKTVMRQLLHAVARPDHHSEGHPHTTLANSERTPSIVNRPLTIYVRTYCPVEEALRPEWAKIVVDRTLYLALVQLHCIVHRDKLAQAHRPGDPSWAIDRKGDLWRDMDSGWLVVTQSDTFRFHARPRYGTHIVETRDVYLATLYKAVTQSPNIASYEYLRRGDVMIYDDNPQSLLDTLLEQGETVTGFTTEADDRDAK